MALYVDEVLEKGRWAKVFHKMRFCWSEGSACWRLFSVSLGCVSSYCGVFWGPRSVAARWQHDVGLVEQQCGIVCGLLGTLFKEVRVMAGLEGFVAVSLV